MLSRRAAILSMLTVGLTAGGCIIRNDSVQAPVGSSSSANAGTAAVGAGGIVSAGSAASAALPVPPGGGVPRPSGPPAHLTVLDWAGFKAAVTYTFDDTNSSQIQHYDQLAALGVRMTFYLITGKTKEFSDPTWTRAVRDGHEIGSHTRSHQHTASAADLEASDRDIQQRFGVPVWTMAAPYGDGSYRAIAATRYLINRGVANGLIAPNDDTDPYNLFCYAPPGSAPASAFNAQIDAARAAGRWKTVLVHGFVGGTDGAYQPVSIDDFVASVNHAKSFGDVWIDTMASVGAYWRAQKMFSAITPATSGNSQTWTWTLPPHFPPGKVLRVKVDGGTLTQPGGRTLAWDDHGYYEVALDAGSLTLSP